MSSRARNQAHLAAEIRRFFHHHHHRQRQRQPHIVRGYFGGPHVRYTLEENSFEFLIDTASPGLTRESSPSSTTTSPGSPA
ncbi:hypothetical protein [Streptomyces roseirectus]|uniref:hypothetical protein n=1 Tax=Streptomyces roseirectus TaxID=2768066 RepID=UPI003CCD6998